TDLALDVLNQKIYYTTSSSTQTNNAIWCMDYTGNNNTKLFAATGGSAGVSRCTAIAVDVAASKIFFTDAGTLKVFSLNLDGTDLAVLANLITSTPVDLTLDTVNHRVYYASDSPTPILNYVWRINYD